LYFEIFSIKNDINFLLYYVKQLLFKITVFIPVKSKKIAMNQNITYLQKKFVFTLVLSAAFCLSTTHLRAQEEDKFDMSVSLNSDALFGFYPFFAGTYAVSDGLDFTFYGILWSGGTGGAWGNWTEFGMGLGFSPSDALYINPQVGLLNGSLLSSGATGNAEFAEGIVPNLTVLYDDETIEGELYAGYYYGFNYGNEDITNNYLHWWASAGYIVNDFISFGGHFEQLQLAGGEGVDESVNLYVTLAPYIKFSDPDGGAFAKFLGGPDLRSDEEVARGGTLNSFFKLSVGYSF